MISEATDPDTPAWVRYTVRASLVGEPNRALAEGQTLRLEQHFGEMSRDPAVTNFELAIEVVRSFATHMAWRGIAGPPTTVGPGILSIVCGVGGLVLALSPFYDLVSAASGSGVFAILSGALLINDSRSGPSRSLPVRMLWAACTLGLIATAADMATQPKVPSDRIASVGFLLIAFAISTQVAKRVQSNTTWKRWLIVGIGVMTVGVSNFLSLAELPDEQAIRVSTVLFVMESAAGLVLIRWALSRRISRPTNEFA